MRNPRKRRTKTEANVFNNPLTETAYHQFYHALLVTQTNTDTKREGITEGCEYQEELLRVILEMATTIGVEKV